MEVAWGGVSETLHPTSATYIYIYRRGGNGIQQASGGEGKKGTCHAYSRNKIYTILSSKSIMDWISQSKAAHPQPHSKAALHKIKCIQRIF